MCVEPVPDNNTKERLARHFPAISRNPIRESNIKIISKYASRSSADANGVPEISLAANHMYKQTFALNSRVEI